MLVGAAVVGLQVPRAARVITALRVEVRCDGCPWPELCKRDITCWKAEADAGWLRKLPEPPPRMVRRSQEYAGPQSDRVRT